VNLLDFIYKHQYEFVLVALIQHLFIGIFLTDLILYARVIWPINMVILGLASVGIFIKKRKWKNYILAFLFILVLILPLILPFAGEVPYFMQILSLIYVAFFAYLFLEVIRFLIRPGYINVDIISASACGYLLLIEMSVFLLQLLFYNNPASISNIDTSNPASTYIDLVYFCTIIQTTIGFGDISPTTHYTKLVVSLFGVFGQFYTVVLVGIIISKFTSTTNPSS